MPKNFCSVHGLHDGEACKYCESGYGPMSDIIHFSHYMHSSKEDNYCQLEEFCEELGIPISDEALTMFSYALYEVEFKLEIDTKTGQYKILYVKCGEQILK
jgi:hypothetical protein